MPIRLVSNSQADRATPYGPAERQTLSHRRCAEVEREISSWPGYRPTPLRELGELARQTGVKALWYKDEAPRFGLGCFKALGGAYGVLRVLQHEVEQRTGQQVASAQQFLAGSHRALVSGMTVTCATDGNHGRSVAWGAEMFGCRSVIYLPAAVSPYREAAIAAYGAEIVRTPGNYDETVRQMDHDARALGRFVVSDTAYPGNVDVPRAVMQGYTVMVAEVLRQLGPGRRPRPTHVFVQGGVGGLAAAVCAHLWEAWGPDRPLLIVVEPENAACLFESAKAGHPVTVTGSLETVMACLSAGEVSALAWPILLRGADRFMTIPDEAAVTTMRRLAGGFAGQGPIVAGESGVAGLAGFLEAMSQSDISRGLGLGADSRVLVFGTEGATDPVIYERIVGRPVGEVAEYR